MVEKITQKYARRLRIKQAIFIFPFITIVLSTICFLITIVLFGFVSKLFDDIFLVLVIVFLISATIYSKYTIALIDFFIFKDENEMSFEDIKQMMQPKNLKNSFENGLEDFKKKEYFKAICIFKELSEFDFSQAQEYLAFMYENGIGCKQDYNEAFRYYKLAANSSAQAQNDLANMYENGFGVEQDYNEALKWYKFSAQNGFNEARYNIGLIYEVVKQDYEEALKWYKLTYESRDKENIFVQKEGDFAYRSQDAKARFDKLKKQIDEEKLNKKDSFEEALEFYEFKNYKKSLEIFQSLKDEDKIKSYYYLAKIYDELDSKNEALKYYLLATKSGDARAQVILGEKFLDQKNYPNAIKCFTMAAKNANKEALRNLGIMYFKAYGVKEDKQKALEFLKQAAKLGDIEAKNFVATYLSAKN